MAKVSVSVVLYAVDLSELTSLVGCKDEVAFQRAWEVVQEDEDMDWDPGEVALLERLLRRLIFEGQLYTGVAAEERYYLTQLLIDLFDEFVDQEALSEDLPFDKLHAALEALPRKSDAHRLSAYLTRGREVGGEAQLWTEGPVEDMLSLLGYLKPEECARLAESLGEEMQKMRERPSGLLKQVRSAAEECATAGMSLISFVG
jgi:hypothetical protein